MILEVADFRTENGDDFEAAMAELVDTLAASAGYKGHSVQRSIETPGRYLLLVRWDSVEAHQGFRGSDRFERWAGRLADHRAGVVAEHFTTVLENGWSVAG